MSETRGFWQDGRIVDDEVRPWRPHRLALLLLAVLVGLDLLIAAALGVGPEPVDLPLTDATDARMVIERAAEDPQPWLLLGDSVLAGDVMEGRVDGWHAQRVIDHLRREQGPQSRATFHQIALNGLLPVDVLRIVTELDRIDPGGRISVVIELNPRYASVHYAEQEACTRAWLCELGVPLLTADGVAWGDWGLTTVEAARRWLVDHLPIARHHRALALDFDLAAVPGLADPLATPEPPDPLQARARLLEHYRDPMLEPESTQIRALAATVARLRAAGRRGVLFTTPVEDAFWREATEGGDDGLLAARWSELVDTEAPGPTALVQLDHPLFDSALFLDHVHMGPEGNRRLAVNLLHELGLPLAHVPPHTQVARPEGPDATLVSRIERGDADGPAWQAAFRMPYGIAVSPGGRRVVIADTDNHVLKELRGNLQTVRTIAGSPGEPGDADGPGPEARLDQPRWPCFLGDDVYFTSDNGRTLRRYRDGHVGTLGQLSGPPWSQIRRIRAAGGSLFLLDRGRQILRVDPVSHRAERVVDGGTQGIVAFDVTDDGRLFVVDRKNRIWVALTSDRVKLGEYGATLAFANTAATLYPQQIGAFYPFSFDEVALEGVLDVRWVERYGGLLVQDEVKISRRRDRGFLTERVHLRLFDLEGRLIYPWLKPRAFGGYVVNNASFDVLVTPMHAGSMALEPQTASLFYLERRRSRLFRFGDGILGAALVGNTNTRRVFNQTRELFASASGDAALLRFRPDQHLDQRLERLPRAGPYLGLMVGSSMLGASDNVGMYSMARRTEELLQDALGYRDGIRFDMLVRSKAAGKFVDMVDAVEAMIDAGVLPDAVFVEVRATHRYFDTLTEEQIAEQLQRLRLATERADALLLFFDLTAMVGRKRDALRVGRGKEIEGIELIARAGFAVIDAGDQMLDDHLRVAPWADPPFARHHASPWGIDATAERYAARIYPALREHLRGRVPSRLREPEDVPAPAQSLGPVFAAYDVDWAAALPPQNPGLMQRRYARGHLELFVDLANLEPALAPDAGADALERMALSCVYAALTRDPATALASRVTIRLARFDSYDEYGQGVLEGADIRLERSLDAEGLEAMIEAVLGGPPTAASPADPSADDAAAEPAEGSTDAAEGSEGGSSGAEEGSTGAG